MDIDRKRLAYAILHEALDADTMQRAAIVERACGGDRELADEVLSMLDTSASVLLDRNAVGVAARLAHDVDDEQVAAGTLLGGWRILRPLGQGGMGAVYLAERSGDEYTQRGALKLIKRGMDSADLLARFRRERRILSQLSHPGIARLLDGGIADDGRPFLVMEYVDGETLPAWVQRTHADLPARVALFLQLCTAVAHAHHQLVVHRDIKPSNVMVDAANQPHLLDFGIAKVIEDTAQPERTATAARLLSRAYAAPEQSGDGAITTATDIYQLGVLLFELLTDQRFRENTQQGVDMATALRLRGDPGIVVARATDPDPLRRYATVEALADDLRRWRDGRPILARADSAAYRLRRFLARNRLGVAATAVVAAAIIAGAGVALWQAQRANREAQAARDQARTADRVKQFMVTLFSAADPAIARGEMPRADELLDTGAARVASELHAEPRIQAELYEAIGGSDLGLGRFDTALDLFDRGIHALENLPHNDPMRVRLLRQRGAIEAELGQYTKALASLESARQASQGLEPDDPREGARIAMITGWVLRDLDRLDESEATLRGALATLLNGSEALTPGAASALNNLAYTLQVAGKRDDALAAYERLSAWGEAHLDADDPQRLWATWSHARALREFGFAQRARDMLEAIRPAMVKVVGLDHSDTAGLDIVLGQAQMDLGDLAAGHARITDAVARSHRASRRNLLWAQAEFALAAADWRMGALSEARAHFEAARLVWHALVGDDHAAVRDCDSYLAAIDARMDPAGDARARLAALVESRRARAEPGLKLTLALQSALAEAAR